MAVNKTKKASISRASDDKSPLGPELSFNASEAYKYLRTNLMFSLPSGKCAVVGVTSSVRGEGKSTTTMNLGYALAESGKKVLLMELDLRLPTVAKRISVAGTPGLSNFLVGMNSVSEVLQPSGLHPNLTVITSGDIPPNPSELLDSKELSVTLEVMRRNFDFILLDLPPVNAVSDALIVSKLTDGIVMVVRQNYTSQRELKEAMRQLKIIDAKVLGFVTTHGETAGQKYKSYGKYKNYKSYGEKQ